MYYQKTIEETIREFHSNVAKGLTRQEISARLGRFGPNLLPTKKKPSMLFKFFSQFKDLLVIILLAATFISLLLGEIIDAVAIATIVIINAIIGFVQEIKAEKTLESLKEKEIVYTLVVRNGQVEKIPTAKIVPGDILILEEGEKIPADARIIESFSLRVDESILTGESLSVGKNPKRIIQKSIPLADRTNMVYKDTEILAGRGKAVVTATGKNTEIGKIAQFLKEATSAKTPLSLELEKVAHMLTITIGIVAILVFLLNFLGKTPLIESLLVSISLAVAAIPEGMPAVVTIILSLGVKRLADKKTIVKKLPAVEALGAIKIIATDKTGTLTQNKINVVKVILKGNQEFTIRGQGYKPIGIFLNNKQKIINPMELPQLKHILEVGILASNATIQKDTNKIIGDTTEAALLVSGLRAKIDASRLRRNLPRIYEIPFSSERKMMSVVVNVSGTKDHILYTKGAPEIILEKCNLTKNEKKKILSKVQNLAAKGLRSLAVAEKKISQKEVKDAREKELLDERGLEYIGISAMQDPLRPEIRAALEVAKHAGISTIMITGDHKQTAVAIAKQAGIFGENTTVLTEEDIENLSKNKLVKQIKDGVNVFARISPMGKLRIVEAIKSIPNTQVAVTGDGVNDAPALKASNIGVAMGLTGTDLTREVADVVITDDNYATIIDAVREGRVIYANLVKFIHYLISCNLSEVIVVTAGVLFGTPLPLIPIQILWINLITDGFPALALGVDPPERDVMEKPPRDSSTGILHKRRWFYMLIEGVTIGVSVFLLFLFTLKYYSITLAQTMTFAALSLSQVVHSFNNRSTRKSLFKIGIFTNKYLILTAFFSILLQVFAIQTDFGNFIFKTRSLNFSHWMVITAISLIPFLVVELKKQLLIVFKVPRV